MRFTQASILLARIAMTVSLTAWALGCGSPAMTGDGDIEEEDTALRYCMLTQYCGNGQISSDNCRVFWEAAAEEAHCTAPSDCRSAGGVISCGCSWDIVVNKTADIERLKDIAREYCPLGSYCECPGVNGFLCVDGLCAWNYTE